jgi:hypothetical protein
LVVALQVLAKSLAGFVGEALDAVSQYWHGTPFQLVVSLVPQNGRKKEKGH